MNIDELKSLIDRLENGQLPSHGEIAMLRNVVVAFELLPQTELKPQAPSFREIKQSLPQFKDEETKVGPSL